jgi:hypothetical protein
MKHLISAGGIALLVSLLTACASTSMKYAPMTIDHSTKPGKIAWASVQCDLGNLSWIEGLGSRTITTYHFSLNDGTDFMLDTLKTEVGDNINLINFTVKERSAIVAKGVIEGYGSLPYSYGLKNGIVVIENKAKGIPAWLATSLSEKTDASYFLVLDADFTNFQYPRLTNLKNLCFDIELALSAYDRTGKCIGSEYWTRRSTHQRGLASDFNTYGMAIDAMITEHGGDIRSFANRFGGDGNLPNNTKTSTSYLIPPLMEPTNRPSILCMAGTRQYH